MRASVLLTDVFARDISDQGADLHHSLWHETVKQTLFNVWLLFHGRQFARGAETALPYRLTAAQREEAQEHFRALWDIIASKQLEPTPLARAKRDRGFQRFLQAATAKPKRQRG